MGPDNGFVNRDLWAERKAQEHSSGIISGSISATTLTAQSGCAVSASDGPHDPSGVVVDDGRVALTLAVRGLVGPDPLKSGEQVQLARALAATCSQI